MLFILRVSIRKHILFYVKLKVVIIIPKKGQLSGFHINCENCGKEIYQTKTQYNRAKHHFCSNKCQKEYQHKLLFEDRECEMCGNNFSVSKKSSQRFCSIKCQGKWQSTQIGELNPRSNKISCNCDYCGKEIFIIQSNYNRFSHHFCNEECRKNWYSEIFSQNEDWKEESRIRATKLLSTNHSTVNTKPQIIVNDLLNEMNIKYRNEENFTYYSIDNYLYEYNLIIEVMGDFWHCNPLKYTKENMRDIQKRRIPKDKAKHTYILNHHNIEILYLWENDIYNNINLCRKIIEEYINNNGVLINYHSFNYSIKNNKIMLNDNIIIPFQDIVA